MVLRHGLSLLVLHQDQAHLFALTGGGMSLRVYPAARQSPNRRFATAQRTGPGRAKLSRSDRLIATETPSAKYRRTRRNAGCRAGKT
jgi:hypothetical protein